MRCSRPTGTQRSARSLVKATARCTQSELLVCTPKIHDLRSASLDALDGSFRGALFDHIWEQGVFPLISNAKTLWTLMGTGPLFHPGKRHVMVVHDLNYAILPHVFGKSFRLWYQFACGAAAQRADVVVCFTNYVSGTIQKRLGIPADRVRVVPQGPGLSGLDKPFQSPVEEPPERPYFLCVGSLQPHKNLAGVLAAWEVFRRRQIGYFLKVVGRAQDGFASLGLDHSRLPPDVEFTGYLSDEDLIDLYRGATGFLYPSLEEGFGLPMVESFYCGCPVIASNRSCLPEVAGSAALLVDPGDPRAIADAMFWLAESPSKAAELRSQGYSRCGIYSWENAGRAMSGILSEAIC